ncbi:NgoMIV family type II restriction endonuclease [Mycolicibacterium sp. OfavD-34-C]|uniref:NgoMIV family type II restriction endonuclease n=1 Tax=Mycolicibacterium sp. OfavD-34-C TaxID=2917746 RepID=UPI001EF45647|nr:NgoMIV family type II restriction endonuclease [Mycolicibacterium sp. OfavD-34-C]MCG7578799.1 restriction endonuclease [Mycolicibacterium sp. OfavD-34-C]
MAETPAWIEQLLGWKRSTEKSRRGCVDLFGEGVAPNLADMSSRASMHLAGYAYETLGIPRSRIRAGNLEDSTASGTALERAIEGDLARQLDARDPDRSWLVSRTGSVADYAQYTHLNELQALLDRSPALRSTFAGDYHVKSDVYVGVRRTAEVGGQPYLHAAISSKWTIRSDRVQNVRHEFGMLVKNRRGRAPHLVLVTGEPLPSRLLSIARGTGEIDAVYHLLFDELDMAVSVLCGDRGLYPEQRESWVEMLKQMRLKPYSDLTDDLILS